MKIIVVVCPLETAIRISGYQDVDIRILEYQAIDKVLIWSPDILIPCTLISWSPDTRPNPEHRKIEEPAEHGVYIP